MSGTTSSSSVRGRHETTLKLHPLAIIGISDHYTRVSMGGSALPSTAATIGLLFGQTEDTHIVGSNSGNRDGSDGDCDGDGDGHDRDPNGAASTRTAITIIDAEEVETSSSADADECTLTDQQMAHIRTKIELHQKVFPQHQVVGWYRITSAAASVDRNAGANEDHDRKEGSAGDGSQDEEGEDDFILPTARDVQIHNGWMREFTTSTSSQSQSQARAIQPIFLLMDSSERPSYRNKKENTVGENAREKLDRDEELPIAIYEMMSGANADSSAFVNLDFGLETFGPERSAVEKVFRSKPKAIPQAQTQGSTASGGDDAGVAATQMKKQDGSSPETNVPTTGTGATVPNASASASTPISASASASASTTESEAERHVQSVLQSVEAMNARVAILLDYLHKTQEGTIEPDHQLLRQVMSLVKQLPLVTGRSILNHDMGDDGNDNDRSPEGNERREREYKDQHEDALVMSYLAALAKTTKAVVGYSEKFRLMEESTMVDSWGRGGFGRKGKGGGAGGSGSASGQQAMGSGQGQGRGSSGDAANRQMHMGMFMD